MSNRLAAATSPYLLQHKDNPVDWWPWCDEAFDEARRRNVPVFLSVGYAACHWCQVTQKRGKMASLQVSGLWNVRGTPNSAAFSALVRALFCLPRLSWGPAGPGRRAATRPLCRSILPADSVYGQTAIRSLRLLTLRQEPASVAIGLA